MCGLFVPVLINGNRCQRHFDARTGRFGATLVWTCLLWTSLLGMSGLAVVGLPWFRLRTNERRCQLFLVCDSCSCSCPCSCSWFLTLCLDLVRGRSSKRDPGEAFVVLPRHAGCIVNHSNPDCHALTRFRVAKFVWSGCLSTFT